MNAPVIATLVQDHVALFEAEQPGAFCFEENQTALWFLCPCGCHQHIGLPIYLAGEVKPEQVAWEWDGCIDAPTLAPSIRRLTGCKYHGHLRNGIWTFEPDSGSRV